MKQLVIFDLDGTLAMNEHRRHFIERPKGEKDWASFHDACDKDLLNKPIAGIAISQSNWHDVRIWTGRPYSVYKKTMDWLYNTGYSLESLALKMRHEGDHRTDVKLKKSWLDELILLEEQKPILAFEDRDSVVAMWRSNGIVCCQVAEGNCL